MSIEGYINILISPASPVAGRCVRFCEGLRRDIPKLDSQALIACRDSVTDRARNTNPLNKG